MPLDIFKNGFVRPESHLFVQYVGGASSLLAEKYYERQIVESCLPSGKSLLERVVRLIQELPLETQKEINSNPHAKYLLTTERHLMNLNIGVVAKAIKQAGSADAFLKQHDEANHKLLDTVLNDSQKKEFLAQCSKLELGVDEEFLKQPLPDKLSELCILIVEKYIAPRIKEDGSTAAQLQNRRVNIRKTLIGRLEKAIRRCECLEDLLPQTLEIIDLNWVDENVLQTESTLNLDVLFDKDLVRNQNHREYLDVFDSGPNLSVIHIPLRSPLTRMYYQTI
jgi:hypothetical protein